MIVLTIEGLPAERRDRRIVFWAAVSHKIRETIDCNLRPSFFPIIKKKLLPREFASSIFRITESPRQRCLYRGRKHDRRFIMMFLQTRKKLRRKAEVSFMKSACAQ